MPAAALTRKTFGEHFGPVIASEKETVVAISVLLRSATWPTARVAPEFTVPVRKSTFSTWNSFSAFCVATAGLASLSSKTSSILRPSTPPPSLTSLVASSRPQRTCWPMPA